MVRREERWCWVLPATALTGSPSLFTRRSSSRPSLGEVVEEEEEVVVKEEGGEEEEEHLLGVACQELCHHGEGLGLGLLEGVPGHPLNRRQEGGVAPLHRVLPQPQDQVPPQMVPLLCFG